MITLASTLLFTGKTPRCITGAVQKVFANDVEDDADHVEMKFLHRQTSSMSNVKWDWPTVEDSEIVDAKLCFAVPKVPIITDAGPRGGKSSYQFDCEGEVTKAYQKLIKDCFH